MTMFHLEVYQLETSNGQVVNRVNVSLTACTIDHLKSVFSDDLAQQIYDGYNLKEKICTAVGTTVPMFGKYNTNAEVFKALRT